MYPSCIAQEVQLFLMTGVSFFPGDGTADYMTAFSMPGHTRPDGHVERSMPWKEQGLAGLSTVKGQRPRVPGSGANGWTHLKNSPSVGT